MSLINTMLQIQTMSLMNQVNIMNMQNTMRLGALTYVPITEQKEEEEEPIFNKLLKWELVVFGLFLGLTVLTTIIR